MILPVIAGPTASGKTAVALALARLADVEVLSADSRQIYRGMDVGTAKPTRAERRLVPHHFIDILHPSETYSAGRYGEEARACAGAVRERGRIPVVVGGSGLYIAAAVDGLFEGPGADPEVRRRLEQRLVAEGVGSLAAELRAADPGLPIDVTKPRRIIRALEVFHLTGLPLSRLHRERKAETGIVPQMFGLLVERGELYRRIEERCDAMLAGGLPEEVDRLECEGVPAGSPALNTVGYAEVRAYRRGEISRDAMVRLFKQNSRRYAKRQMTWFRRDPRVVWIPADGGRRPEDVADEILRRLRR